MHDPVNLQAAHNPHLAALLDEIERLIAHLRTPAPRGDPAREFGLDTAAGEQRWHEGWSEYFRRHPQTRDD